MHPNKYDFSCYIKKRQRPSGLPASRRLPPCAAGPPGPEGRAALLPLGRNNTGRARASAPLNRGEGADARQQHLAAHPQQAAGRPSGPHRVTSPHDGLTAAVYRSIATSGKARLSFTVAPGLRGTHTASPRMAPRPEKLSGCWGALTRMRPRSEPATRPAAACRPGFFPELRMHRVLLGPPLRLLRHSGTFHLSTCPREAHACDDLGVRQRPSLTPTTLSPSGDQAPHGTPGPG